MLALLQIAQQALDALQCLGRRRAQSRGDLAHGGGLGIGPRLGARAGQRLDPPYAARHAALAHDPEVADLAGASDMRAAAQLARTHEVGSWELGVGSWRLLAQLPTPNSQLPVGAADRDHAHPVAVLLAK